MGSRFSRHRGVAALALLVGTAGCARWFHREPAGPTDANLAAIFLAANNTDISYAQLAPTRAASPAVTQFASRMLADHNALNQQATALFTRINLVPEDNVTSLDFRDESANKRDILRELSGRAFDSTYMENEVSYHTKLLGALDGLLIPGAKHPELKQMMSSVRPAVVAHLEHAQRARATVIGR
jgi:putative membrane protein